MSEEQERIIEAFRAVGAVFEASTRALVPGTYAVLEFGNGVMLVLDEDGRPTNPARFRMNNETLMGRGLALMLQFADDLSRSFGGPPMGRKKRDRLNRHRISKLTRRGAGGYFEVMLVDDDKRDTGYIARVDVTYSRFDEEAANAAVRR